MLESFNNSVIISLQVPQPFEELFRCVYMSEVLSCWISGYCCSNGYCVPYSEFLDTEYVLFSLNYLRLIIYLHPDDMSYCVLYGIS